MKKIDDAVKDVTGSDKNQKKGRPTCKRDVEEEQRAAAMRQLTTPSLKFIGMQIEKLENMHVILTAEDGMSKSSEAMICIDLGKIMDEFEREFQSLREEVRTVKDKLNKR